MINLVLMVHGTDNTLPFTMSESDIVEIERGLMTKSFSNEFFQVTSRTYVQDPSSVYWIYLEKSSGKFTKVDNWWFQSCINPKDCVITFKTDIEGKHVVIGQHLSGVLERSMIYSGVAISFDKFFYIIIGFALVLLCLICGCSKYNNRSHSTTTKDGKPLKVALNEYNRL